MKMMAIPIGRRLSREPNRRLSFATGGHFTFTNICDSVFSVYGEGNGCGDGFIETNVAYSIVNEVAMAFVKTHVFGEKHHGDILDGTRISPPRREHTETMTTEIFSDTNGGHSSSGSLLYLGEVIQCDERSITGRYRFDDEPFFEGHFPDYPVVPGVILVEGLAQTLAYTLLFGRWAVTPFYSRG